MERKFLISLHLDNLSAICYSYFLKLLEIIMSAERQFFVPPEGPPQGIQPNPEIYLLMGEDNIYQMLEDFYHELEKSSIRHLFPQDMKEASRRSAAFFVFIMGGPPIYQQKFGAPRMRQRHLPFAIDEAARQVWLNCFKSILQDADKKYHFPMQHMQSFWHFLDQFSAWMVNTK
jgi:hemoglobin